jgi:hypothetical protein
MRNKLFSLAIVAMLVMAAGCAKVPQAEIDSAQASLQEAQMAGAEIYQPEQMAALQDSFNKVMEQIEAEKSKFFASYGDVKDKLAAISQHAVQVQQSTIERKEMIKLEIQASLAEISTLLAENNALIEKAPKGKEGVAALEMIKTDMSVIESNVAETNALLETGDLIAAQGKANAAKEKAMGINTELKTVMEKAAKKGKR